MEEDNMNNGIKGNGKPRPRLVVVRSNGNKGKTTTIWMVLYELISRGATVRSFKDYSGLTSVPTTMPPVGSLCDFEAEVDWNGKYIILFSHGDTPSWVQTLMNAALAKNPDYIVCASRSQYRTNSTWELFETIYTNIRFERVCLWSEHSANITDALLVKQPTVEAIVKYMA